jgi:predicted membrane GTPase involved in stress response
MTNLPGKDVAPLLDMILTHFPAAKTLEALDAPFSMSVNTIQSGKYVCTYVCECVYTTYWRH